MKGAGPEPHLYWFIEANDPENITLPPQVAATLAPVTSQSRHHATRAVNEKTLVVHDVNDS